MLLNVIVYKVFHIIIIYQNKVSLCVLQHFDFRDWDTCVSPSKSNTNACHRDLKCLRFSPTATSSNQVKIASQLLAPATPIKTGTMCRTIEVTRPQCRHPCNGIVTYCFQAASTRIGTALFNLTASFGGLGRGRNGSLSFPRLDGI